ncbi:MAG TPA: aldo/keto reductase, partial [Planctomycetota bacterium]|nr:aldo/keto reductase [Planctomycetota bacterium]
IQAGLDAGITMIDTAPAYGLGRGEEIVGKAIRGRRDKVVLVTKCGLTWKHAKGTFFFATDDKGKNDAGPYRLHKYLGPECVREDLEASLQKLGTDYIDLYMTHWQDPGTPIEDTMALLLDFKAQGKIRAIGACNATVGDLERYRARGPFDADQERYSMLDRNLEKGQLQFTQRNNIAVLAYSPLHHGLLTGKVTPDRTFKEGDLRNGHPSFSPENLRRVGGMLEKLAPVADRRGITMGQLAVAWALAQPGLTHALVGARDARQAVENAKAGDVVLSPDDLGEISRVLGA